MKPFLPTVLVLIAQAVPGWAGAAKPLIRCPEDLGPTTIDVSSYPPEQQQAYRELFVPIMKAVKLTAHYVNSPLIELDPAAAAREKAAHPELFSDPQVAQVSTFAWRDEMKRLRNRPRCCGFCPALTLDQARRLRNFLKYDSIARKTGSRADAWIAHRKELVARFAREYPDAYAQWKASLPGPQENAK